MSKRRDPAPTFLTTGEAARRLGVSPDFVLGELRDGRLRGFVLERPAKRPIYRVDRQDLEAYIARVRWTRVR